MSIVGAVDGRDWPEAMTGEVEEVAIEGWGQTAASTVTA
jgi:hypothetical protein